LQSTTRRRSGGLTEPAPATERARPFEAVVAGAVMAKLQQPSISRAPFKLGLGAVDISGRKASIGLAPHISPDP
jgi:hypothetical protein